MNWNPIKPEDFARSPFAAIGKQWMLVAAQKPDGTVNAMTASWGGMGVMWGKNVVFVFVRPQRYTREFIDAAGRFTLSFFPEQHRPALAYLGKVSGRDEPNKIAKTGLTVENLDGAPAFAEAETAIVCRPLYAGRIDPAAFLADGIDAQWYPDKDYHIVYVAEVESIHTR